VESVIQAAVAVLESLEHLVKAEQELRLEAVELAEHQVQVSLTQAAQENLPLEQSAQTVVQAAADYWQSVQTQRQRLEQLADKAAAAAELDITRQLEQLAALAQF
jgi:hypothetical protein